MRYNRQEMDEQVAEDCSNAFVKAERELGLNQQFFEDKFVYSQQQNRCLDAYLLSPFQPLPSQYLGFSFNQVRVVQALAAKMLLDAGKALGVPISTTVLAQLLVHFFFTKKDYIHYDFRDALIGSMYLACKSEQTLRKGYEIVLVFDHIFKLYEGEKFVKPIEIDCPEYLYMKKNKIVDAELDILFELGFQVHRLLDIPHRYMGSFLNLFDKNENFPQIAKSAWAILNDIYLTMICLYYPPQSIAAAAVFVAMRRESVSCPSVPWWILMETTLEIIEHIEVELCILKENEALINLKHVGKMIEKTGEKVHGLKNVFPVPYYRKILYDRNGKIRISKQQLAQEDYGEQQERDISYKSNASLKLEESDSNMKKKKKKTHSAKKHKSKHKHKSKKSKKDRDKKKDDERSQQPKEAQIGYSLIQQHQELSDNDQMYSKDRSRHPSPTSNISSKINRSPKDSIPSRNLTELHISPVSQVKPKNITKANDTKLDSLNKKSLLSSINKQLDRHKQKVEKMQEFRPMKSPPKATHGQKQPQINSDDQQLQMIQELKKKIKQNRQCQQNSKKQ